MDVIEMKSKKRKKSYETVDQKRWTYYGHNFAIILQYPKEGKKESNIVVTSNVGKYRCLFAAQVDGSDDNGNIVELKTHREIFNRHHVNSFRKNKLCHTFM